MSCLYRHSSLEGRLNKVDEKQAINLRVATNKKVESRVEPFWLHSYGIKTGFESCGEVHIIKLVCFF